MTEAAAAPRLGCGAAIVRDGRILLVKRCTEPEAGHWGLPGGKVDLYETIAEATEREVREELRMAIEVRDLLCLVDQIDRADGIHWVAPVFLVTRFLGEPAVIEPDKHGDLGWFPLDAMAEPLTVPTRRALRALRERAQSPAITSAQ